MISIEKLKLVCRGFEKKWPERFDLCYPRSIDPPSGGYVSPRFFAMHLGAISMQTENALLKGETVGGVDIASLLLIQNKVPTFFVHPEFLKAIADTDIEEGFTFDELKWPFDSMLFCLPVKLSKEIFGVEVPWISIGKTPTGEWDMPLSSIHITTRIQVARVAIHFPVFLKDDEFAEDFGGMWPIDGKLIDLINTTPHLDTIDLPNHFQSGALGEEKNKQINDKGMRLAVLLMMGMVARPEYVKMGELLCKGKNSPRSDKVQRELWKGNVIGKGYTEDKMRVLDEHEHTERAHGSPRAHRRRGHFRNAVVGSRALPLEHRPRKLIWIEPMWINL